MKGKRIPKTKDMDPMLVEFARHEMVTITDTRTGGTITMTLLELFEDAERRQSKDELSMLADAIQEATSLLLPAEEGE